jgi:hypothetical protein
MSVVYLGFPVGAKTGFMLAGPPKEVVMTVGTAPCNVFDADLPTLSYSPDETPAEVYPRFQAAQQQAPVARTPTSESAGCAAKMRLNTYTRR